MPSVRYRYLLGAMQQIGVTTLLRTHCVAEEQARQEELVERWRRASARMQELAQVQAGAAETVQYVWPLEDVLEQLRTIETDPLFRASFSAVPTRFSLVEIDKLVAPQIASNG